MAKHEWKAGDTAIWRGDGREILVTVLAKDACGNGWLTRIDKSTHDHYPVGTLRTFPLMSFVYQTPQPPTPSVEQPASKPEPFPYQVGDLVMLKLSAVEEQPCIVARIDDDHRFAYVSLNGSNRIAQFDQLRKAEAAPPAPNQAPPFKFKSALRNPAIYCQSDSDNDI